MPSRQHICGVSSLKSVSPPPCCLSSFSGLRECQWSLKVQLRDIFPFPSTVNLKYSDIYWSAMGISTTQYGFSFIRDSYFNSWRLGSLPQMSFVAVCIPCTTWLCRDVQLHQLSWWNILFNCFPWICMKRIFLSIIYKCEVIILFSLHVEVWISVFFFFF